METGRQAFRDLGGLIARLLGRWTAFGVLPRTYGAGCRIYPSEISVIEQIGREPGINVTRLAACLGVTKGAVSQTVGKLVRKELLRKAEGAWGVCPELTARGRIAFRNNEKFYELAYRLFLTRYGRCAPTRMAGFRGVFVEFNAFFEEFIRHCPADLPVPRRRVTRPGDRVQHTGGPDPR